MTEEFPQANRLNGKVEFLQSSSTWGCKHNAISHLLKQHNDFLTANQWEERTQFAFIIDHGQQRAERSAL